MKRLALVGLTAALLYGCATVEVSNVSEVRIDSPSIMNGVVSYIGISCMSVGWFLIPSIDADTGMKQYTSFSCALLGDKPGTPYSLEEIKNTDNLSGMIGRSCLKNKKFALPASKNGEPAGVLFSCKWLFNSDKLPDKLWMPLREA